MVRLETVAFGGAAPPPVRSSPGGHAPLCDLPLGVWQAIRDAYIPRFGEIWVLGTGAGFALRVQEASLWQIGVKAGKE